MKEKGGRSAQAGADPRGPVAARQGEKRSGPEKAPWIETREGGWFFVNALLIMPELVVLIPLAARGVVGLLAPHRPPSPFLDTIPFVASRALPYLGWFLVVPMGTVLWNLRLERKLLPRLFLALFFVLHLAFLGYTARSWLG